MYGGIYWGIMFDGGIMNIDTTMAAQLSKDNKLILMHGLPRSGKSTWALEQGYPVVCPDAIRYCTTGKRWWGPIEYHIWATAKTMVRSLFLAGHKIVILDSTSRTRGS
jgi:predicted kinase